MIREPVVTGTTSITYRESPHVVSTGRNRVAKGRGNWRNDMRSLWSHYHYPLPFPFLTSAYAPDRMRMSEAQPSEWKESRKKRKREG